MDVWGTYGAGFAEPSSARYLQTSAPTAEPVTLDEVKAQCSLLGSTDWDVMLLQMISEARRILEQRHNRQLMQATWMLSLDAFPDEISIDRVPVASVDSIHYIDYAGNAQTLDPSQYQVDLSSSDRPARIRPVWGLIWPITRVGTFNAVTVHFIAGYANAKSVPVSYRRAILILVYSMWRNRDCDADGRSHAERAFEWLMQADDPGIYG